MTLTTTGGVRKRMKMDKPASHYKKHLADFISEVNKVLISLDNEMKRPADLERGQRLAAIANFLEIAKARVSANRSPTSRLS
jgi:hypothetical protein